MAPMPPVDKPYVILAEGNDDEKFLKALLCKQSISDVLVRQIRGKTNLRPELEAFLQGPFNPALKGYAIILDADENHAAAFQSVRDALYELEEPVPARSGEYASSTGNRRVGVFLLPGTDRNGCLEDLCLETVKDFKTMPCVERYFDCLEAECIKKDPRKPRNSSVPYFPKHSAKARAAAYLAGRYELMGVGSAAKAGYWNLDHAALDSLRQFLAGLRK